MSDTEHKALIEEIRTRLPGEERVSVLKELLAKAHDFLCGLIGMDGNAAEEPETVVEPLASSDLPASDIQPIEPESVPGAGFNGG